MSRRSRIRPFAYILNEEGMDENKSVFYVKPSAAKLIRNLHRDTRGSFTAKDIGYTALTAQLEAGAGVDALGWFTNIAGTDYLLCAINGKVKHIHADTGAEIANIETALTAGNRVDFAPFKGILYAAETSVNPKKWTGTGLMSAAGGFPLINGAETYEKPTVVEVYANRLVYGNFQGATPYPAHIAISNDLTPETFTIATTNDTDGAVRQIAPGDGQAIVAMKTLYLPEANRPILVVFKERSLYYLEGDTPTTFKTRLLNETMGCLNNECVVKVGNDLIFLDQNTITSLSTANQGGNVQTKDLASVNVRKTLATLNITQKNKAWAIHIPDRREVWFGIPTGASTQVDTILVYRYPDDLQNADEPGQWTIRKGTAPSFPLLYKKTFFTGAYNGVINKWFGASTYAGTGIHWIYEYHPYAFEHPTQNKRIQELLLWFLVDAPHTITVTTEWQKGAASSQKKSFTKTFSANNQAVYGTTAPPAGIYGTDYYGDTQLVKVKVPVYGNGELFGLKISGTTGATGPAFLGATGLVEFFDYSRSYK